MSKKAFIAAVSAVVLYVAIAVGLIFFYNSLLRHYEPRVLVTATGECYHSGDCYYLRKSAIPISRSEAKEGGYRACSACGGQTSGTIAVNDYGNAIAYSLITVTVAEALGALIYFSIAFKTSKTKQE